MGRVDIVIFPDGGREIFARQGPAPAGCLDLAIASHMATLAPAAAPLKLTGLYNAADASDITWQPFDPANPIPLPEPDQPLPAPPP